MDIVKRILQTGANSRLFALSRPNAYHSRDYRRPGYKRNWAKKTPESEAAEPVVANDNNKPTKPDRVKTIKEKKLYEKYIETKAFESLTFEEQHEYNTAAEYFGNGAKEFVTSLFRISDLKEGNEPSVAFNGRSNVGKSSLTNAVLGVEKLVKTSGKPGHTKSLNFFKVSGNMGSIKTMNFVDMPGYGHRSRAEWGKLIMGYFKNSKQLKKIYLLIDSKVGELKESDIMFLELVEKYNIPVQLILTKADKQPKLLKKTKAKVLEQGLEVCEKNLVPEILSSSSKTEHGISQVRINILKTCFGT